MPLAVGVAAAHPHADPRPTQVESAVPPTPHISRQRGRGSQRRRVLEREEREGPTKRTKGRKKSEARNKQSTYFHFFLLERLRGPVGGVRTRRRSRRPACRSSAGTQRPPGTQTRVARRPPAPPRPPRAPGPTAAGRSASASPRTRTPCASTHIQACVLCQNETQHNRLFPIQERVLTVKYRSAPQRSQQGTVWGKSLDIHNGRPEYEYLIAI